MVNENLPVPALKRSGSYAQQVGGYKAFIPRPLPPLPLLIDSEMQTLLSDADRAVAALDSSIQTLPDQERFIWGYVRKEAVLSSQIEETQSSLSDLLKAEAQIDDPSIPRDVNQVSNLVAALNMGINRLSTLPVSSRLIRDVHGRLMENIRGDGHHAGMYRTDPVWIGPKGCTLFEATFIPPPASEVERCMGELESYIHQHAAQPSLIQIGLVHAQFETIHPFKDGNGRLGRMLITLLLYEKQLLTKPVLYLSHYLKANRSEYYERLQRIRDHDEWEEWLKFFLRGVTEVARDATRLARDIARLREEHWRIIANNFGARSGKALQVIDYLYSHPHINVSMVQQLVDVSFANANTLVDDFVKHGLLAEVTGNARNRIFVYAPYVMLLNGRD